MAERPRAAKESQHTEWKESWRDDHLRWVCGFANAEGGVLGIGRNDKGQAAGIPDAGRREPAISFDQAGLWVSFEFSKAYRDLIEKPQGGERPERGTTQVTTQVTTEVRLLQAMTTELSRKAILAALGLQNREHFRKTYLLPALERGLIEMTIPDKPNSRLQKYRMTSAGRALLQAAKPKVGSR